MIASLVFWTVLIAATGLALYESNAIADFIGEWRERRGGRR